jgi:uncharacterized protein (DUF2062 family)
MGLAVGMFIAYIPFFWWVIFEVISQNKEKNSHK